MRRPCCSLLLFVSLLVSAPSRAEETAEEPIYQGKGLAEWIGDLKDPKQDKRLSAVQALAVFGPKKEVVSALAAALKDDDRTVILHAAQTLGKFGSKAKEALPALRDAFKKLSKDDQSRSHPSGPSPTLGPDEVKMIYAPRRAVAEALILIDDKPSPELASILVDALETNDADKRCDLVIKLGKLGPDAAKITVPALISILAETDKDVSPPVKNGSGILEARRSDSPPIEKIKAIRLEAVKSLGQMGPAAKPAVHAVTMAMKFAAPEKDTRMQQMQVSATPVGSPDGQFRTISFTLVTGDKAMLVACAEALGRVRPEAKGTLGALRLALRDLDDGVRWAALCALLESGQDTREVVPMLLQFVGDKDAALRRATVEALGKSGSEAKAILPALTTTLKDENASVRESAAKSLGEIGTKAKSSAPGLIAALKDTNTEVRREAAEALGKIGTTDREVVAALIEALNDKEENVIGAAGVALSKMGERAKAAIPVLLPRLRNTDPKSRGEFCLLVGEFGPTAKEAIPDLEKRASDDSDQRVRLTAYTALAKIDSSRVKDTVRRLTAALPAKIENTSLFGSDSKGEIALVCLKLLGPAARDALPALRALRERSSSSSLDDAIQAIENPKKDCGKR